MCSSGVACSHTVVHWASSRLNVAGSDDDAARRRDHRLGVRRIDLVERAPLVAAIRGRPVQRHGSRGRLQPAMRSISRFSSTNGSSSSSASMPAERATCRRRAGRSARCAGARAGRRRRAEQLAERVRARCSSASLRPCRISRIISHSGELAVSSPTSSASEQSSAPRQLPQDQHRRVADARSRGWQDAAPTRRPPARAPCASGRGAPAARACARRARRETGRVAVDAAEVERSNGVLRVCAERGGCIVCVIVRSTCNICTSLARNAFGDSPMSAPSPDHAASLERRRPSVSTSRRTCSR